jgi:hypothetical protein
MGYCIVGCGIVIISCCKIAGSIIICGIIAGSIFGLSACGIAIV